MIETLVLATHNSDKVREFSSLLNPYNVTLSSSKDFDVREPEETGKTFKENALLKARTTFAAVKKPTLADDSGFCVDAINAKPGIYSARWAKREGSFQAAAHRINELCTGKSDLSAYFICALAYIDEKGDDHHFQGRIDGQFVYPGRGSNGLGYDSYFIPKGFTKTFGEMTLEEKEAISHRTLAFKKFVEFCKN